MDGLVDKVEKKNENESSGAVPGFAEGELGSLCCGWLSLLIMHTLYFLVIICACVDWKVHAAFLS